MDSSFAAVEGSPPDLGRVVRRSQPQTTVQLNTMRTDVLRICC
jgi:hypothetical protein